ncbi:MAG TPA: VOC family protein [Solirubrobacteraceae bacterium]|jgi:predicted enzyme related to lactoylglutathione lyase
MGERTQYTPGTFSWTDLNTTDQDAAKGFYAALFGWTYNDSPVGDGVVYSMAQIEGRNVAAISPQPQQQREAGVPPAWNSYITVENADATLARAKELGGTVHADAFDVMEAGRMGVIQDPQGAYFEVWEAKQTIGAGLVNAPGALSWNELGTPDIEAAATFYGDLFGWTTTPMEGDMPYLVVKTAADRSNGGIRPPMPEGTPPFWLVYFATADLDATLATVSEHGGTVLMGNTDIGIARIAVAQDPQGAVFALYAGQLED